MAKIAGRSWASIIISVLVVAALGADACGGPYGDLEKAYPAKADLQTNLVTSRNIVLTGKHHSGAYNLRGIANIGLMPMFVEVSVDKPFGFFHKQVQIPIEAIAGCSKKCFGPDKWDADLLLSDLDIEVSIENSQEVLDWCWENNLPMISSSARRAWMYEGKVLPSKSGYVRVSKDEYASQAKSACMGY